MLQANPFVFTFAGVNKSLRLFKDFMKKYLICRCLKISERTIWVQLNIVVGRKQRGQLKNPLTKSLTSGAREVPLPVNPRESKICFLREVLYP